MTDEELEAEKEHYSNISLDELSKEILVFGAQLAWVKHSPAVQEHPVLVDVIDKAGSAMMLLYQALGTLDASQHVKH